MVEGFLGIIGRDFEVEVLEVVDFLMLPLRDHWSLPSMKLIFVNVA
jgi:hypothetical protein